jgi:hypothetical protein
MQRSSEQNQAKINTVIFISHLIEKKTASVRNDLASLLTIKIINFKCQGFDIYILIR